MAKNFLCERVEESEPLHIYINSDKFTKGGEYTICASFDGEELAYGFKLHGDNIVAGLDEFMGILGRDTQNWWHKDIILHWGVHTWKFYNAKNISDFDKECYEEFGIDPYDYDNIH